MPEVTQKQVAAVVGVDVSTVSRALDPAKSHMVKAETLALIRETADRLGYRVDQVAGALRRGSTNTAGVIVADLGNPFFAPIIHGISQTLSPHQLVPVIGETNYDHDVLVRQLDRFLSRRVDAMIVVAARLGDSAAIEDAACAVPTILAASGLVGCSVPQVLHDDRGGARLVAEHLHALGHRRVVELRGPSYTRNFADRHLGFRDACVRAGVELLELPQTAERPGREQGEHLARLLLALHGDDLPTAVFAHNDLLALGALTVLKQSGVAVPGDVSLAGYNNALMVDQLDPPLTTVHYPGSEIGRSAGLLALNLIRGVAAPAEPVHLAPQLHVRNSTAPPRG